MAHTQTLSKSEITYYTNYWCKSKGISAKDLEAHPQIDDVVLLINYRDSMWSKLNKSEQAHWGAVWDWCYHRKFALKKKHLKKFESIIQEANQRHTEKLNKILKARNKIFQLRHPV